MSLITEYIHIFNPMRAYSCNLLINNICENTCKRKTRLPSCHIISLVENEAIVQFLPQLLQFESPHNVCWCYWSQWGQSLGPNSQSNQASGTHPQQADWKNYPRKCRKRRCIQCVHTGKRSKEAQWSPRLLKFIGRIMAWCLSSSRGERLLLLKSLGQVLVLAVVSLQHGPTN